MNTASERAMVMSSLCTVHIADLYGVRLQLLSTRLVDVPLLYFLNNLSLELFRKSSINIGRYMSSLFWINIPIPQIS